LRTKKKAINYTVYLEGIKKRINFNQLQQLPVRQATLYLCKIIDLMTVVLIAVPLKTKVMLRTRPG
jgi:hypothetical protein